MRRAVIFDFDGTLADSLKVVLAIFHELTGGAYESKAKDVEAFRNKPAHKAIRELGIHWWQIPALMAKGRKVMHSRMSEVQPFPDIVEAIKQLDEHGYQMYILSSNSAANIKRFLESHHLSQYFKYVQGNTAVFGKTTAIRKIIASKHLKNKDCIYVGDEVRDVSAAKRVGIPILAVSWGYNSKEALLSSKPNLVINSASELVASIESLQGV